MFMDHIVANFHKMDVKFQIITDKNKMVFTCMIPKFPENNYREYCSWLLFPINGHDFIGLEASVILRKIFYDNDGLDDFL